MFKKMVCSVFLIMVSVTSLSAAELKIGVVDFNLVMSKSPQVETIRGKLQAQFADQLSELKKMSEDLQAKDEALKTNALTMTEEQRINASREIETIQTSFQLKQKQFQDDQKRAQQKEIRLVQGIVVKAINEIAAAESFDLILRAEAAIFVSKAQNISDKVITKISDPAGG